MLANNPLKSDESNNQNSKNCFNSAKINFDIIRAYKDKRNNILNKQNNKSNNKDNKENKNYSKFVSQ